MANKNTNMCLKVRLYIFKYYEFFIHFNRFVKSKYPVKEPLFTKFKIAYLIGSALIFCKQNTKISLKCCLLLLFNIKETVKLVKNID